jgi:class 3 adenylate cyclase
MAKTVFQGKVWKLLLSFLLLLPLQLSSQVGGSYFADFQLKEFNRQVSSHSMVQDAEGNLQLATLRGVVVFDGTYSQLVGTGSFIYKLDFVPELSRVYAACAGRIGYVSKNSFGKYAYTRIPLKADENEEFTGICHIGKDVYVMSPNRIIKINGDKITEEWSTTGEKTFSGIFAFGGKVFTLLNESGLYTLENGKKLKKHPVNDGLLANDVILFSVERKSGELLLGTLNNQLFLFTGATCVPQTLAIQNSLNAAGLWTGCKTDPNHIALGTRTGGVFIINSFNGELSESLNVATGFPDDQVHAMLTDQAGGVWVSHDQGLSRIDKNVPVKNYSSYPGITSRITAVAESNGILYAGTLDGVYWLKPAAEDEFNKALQSNAAAARASAQKGGSSGSSAADVEDDKALPAPETPETPAPGTSETPAGTEQAAPSGNAGQKLKEMWRRVKKKSGDALDGGTKSPTKEKNIKGNEGPVSYFRSQPFFKFAAFDNGTSKQFIFSKIGGIEGKVRKLLVAADGLYCATSVGLYLYGAEGVTRIYDHDVFDMAVAGSQVYFLGNAGLFTTSSGSTPELVKTKSTIRNPYSLHIENNYTIWIGSSNKAYRLALSESHQVLDQIEINMPSDIVDYVTVARSGGSLYFAMSNGIFKYVHATRSVLPVSNIRPVGDYYQYISSNSGNSLFIKSGEGWKELKGESDLANVYLMDIIGQVRYIAPAASGNLWVLSADGRIYQVKRNVPGGGENADLQVFIRSVNGLSGNAFDLSNLLISYNEGEVEFRWGSNIFLKSDVTWYQYKIDGLGGNQWSPWTTNTSLKISLQPGNYKFNVRARDANGNVSQTKTLGFTIEPPFWQTWWFYTLLALLLGVIIYFIFRWRNRALLEKQKLLESMVKLRTEELEAEKEITENLLLNILPVAVANELKSTGKSSVRKHNDSAVMFTDFCDFTRNSSGFSAEELVLHLDSYFRKFDKIVGKFGLEKIKTIGDAYMCAAGVPEFKKLSTARIVAAGLEILNAVKNEPTGWKIRVGVHQGELVSGVVGEKKFAYDIWGDTVNIASRMESSGVPMSINISQVVYDQIKNYFSCEFRGEIDAKSLGKTNMYLVTGFKPEFADSENSLIPNNAFLELLN